MCDDTDLMMRAKAGDTSAFTHIVGRHQTSILNLCFRIIGQQQEAEEVAQDVFIELYRSAHRYQPTARLSTYLYRIAVNRSLNRVRDLKRRPGLSAGFRRPYREDTGASVENMNRPDVLLERTELQRAVQAAIQRLPARQRTAVVLRRFHGLTYAEIANVMKCSVSAVESRLFRARKSLERACRHLIE